MKRRRERLRKMQSSPGYLHVGHVPSKWTWQMPQTSSSGISHRHVATAFHFLILTFILAVFPSILGTLKIVIIVVGFGERLRLVMFTSRRRGLPLLQSSPIFTCRAASYQQLAANTHHSHHTNLPAESQPLFPNKLLLSFVFLPSPLTSTASPFSYYALPLFNRSSTTNATPITASR